MPTNFKSPVSNSTPGLNSIDNSKGSLIAMNVPRSSTPIKPKPTVKTPTPNQLKNPAVSKHTVPKPASPKYTKSSFKVGENTYNIIDDSDQARKLIKYDDKGNVAPDSPVHVIGKNIGGGFILAANEGLKGVKNTTFPISDDAGIHFPSLESDTPGSKPLMQNIHRASYKNINEISNPKAASALRGIYKRTGRI